MSAAKRVAHAAETVRARWEQQVSTDPQTEAAQALEDTGQLLDPEVAAELAAFRKGRELAEAVAREGALPVPVGPVDAGPVVLPLELPEAQVDALAAAGNRVVNDANHDDLCMCDGWPEKCVSSGGYFQGYWDMGGLESAIPAVLGLWERMRGGELGRLRARVAELEAERHSTNEVLDDAVQELRAKEVPAGPYPPVMRWAALLDREDLAEFLDELAASAITNASSDVALAEVETTCRTWRLIAEAQHGHNTAPGPDAVTRAFAPVAALREDPHDGPLAHKYLKGRDLPKSCRLNADQADEVSRTAWFGGGAQ